MADINTALIAFLGVLAGGYFNNFLGDDYKRFRDSQALAGALAGELESHAQAVPTLKKSLAILRDMAGKGISFQMPESEDPPSPIFDKNIGSIGSLGPDMARGVAFVYENIRAFRAGMLQLSKVNEHMTHEWKYRMLVGCLERINAAESAGLPLVEQLKAHAKMSYWSLRGTRKQYSIAVGLVFSLVATAMAFSGAPSGGQNCTTVIDQAKGSSTTICK